MKLLKLAITVFVTLCVAIAVTAGWIAMLLKKHGNAGYAVDIPSLMTLQHAPLYWFVLLAVIAFAGVAYWRWAGR